MVFFLVLRRDGYKVRRHIFIERSALNGWCVSILCRLRLLLLSLPATHFRWLNMEAQVNFYFFLKISACCDWGSDTWPQAYKHAGHYATLAVWLYSARPMFITPISTRWVMWSISHRSNLKTHPSHLCVPYLWCYLHINYTHIKLVWDVVNNIPSTFTSYNLNLVPHLSLVEAGALLIVQTCFDVKTSLWPPHLQPSVPATALLLFLYFPVNIL